jgi:hypothetical protein
MTQCGERRSLQTTVYGSEEGKTGHYQNVKFELYTMEKDIKTSFMKNPMN